MSFDYSKLEGRIKEKYGTQGNFAKAINMSERTLSTKINNLRQWKQKEIIVSCDALDIPYKDIPLFFYCKSSKK